VLLNYYSNHRTAVSLGRYLREIFSIVTSEIKRDSFFFRWTVMSLDALETPPFPGVAEFFGATSHNLHISCAFRFIITQQRPINRIA
jgi:hypothetical protein